MENKDLNRLKKIITESNNIVFFGGAGVSTESGIPDFRSKNGLYNQHDVNFAKYQPEYLLSKDCFQNEPKVFYEFYRQKMDVRNYEPNTTHKVLAKMEAKGKLSGIVTQNIDRLHQKSGSKKVYEIHGTTYRNYCIKCHREFDENYIFDSINKIPRCPNCGQFVRPDVILYGENLPEEAVKNALNAIESADCLIVGGTSLQVYPAAAFLAHFAGEHLIIINNEKINIPLNPDTDMMIVDSLGNVFSEIEKMI